MKMKLPVVFVLLLVLTGLAAAQTIETGDFSAAAGQDGYTLHTGKGERVFTQTVAFEKGFQSPPKVHLSLSGYEAREDLAGVVRVRVSATKITKTGFSLQVKTWGDGSVNSVWGTWMAVGVR
jgi:hypothetical protein